MKKETLNNQETGKDQIKNGIDGGRKVVISCCDGGGLPAGGGDDDVVVLGWCGRRGRPNSREQVQRGIRKGDCVPELRDGEGGHADEGVLWGGDGHKGEGPGVPLLLYPADPQRERHHKEHGHPRVPPPPTPLRLLHQERLHLRVPQ